MHAGLFLLVCLCSGCAALFPQSAALLEQPPPELPRRTQLDAVPFFPQLDYQCGPAALAMVLAASGADVTPEALTGEVYLPARQGSLQIEMLAAARRHGRVAYRLAPQFGDVLREVAAGAPVIVLQNYGFGWLPIWHYAVVVGYDIDRGEVTLRSGRKPRLVMPFGVFEYLWKDGERWAMVALPPQRLPVTATEHGYGEAAVTLERTGQIDTARVAYATLLARWPDSLVGLMGAGNVAHARGDLQAAEQAFRKAAETHSDSAAALNNLAQTLADRGKLNEAAVAARRAVSLGGPLRATAESTLQGILARQRNQND